MDLAPGYRTTCPWCNGQLYPIAYTPEAAPWLCVICSHSWWAAELSEEARKQFRPAFCDFGFGLAVEPLQLKVMAERDEARARKTSVRSDQIQLLPLVVLQHLPQADDEFGSMVKLEITRKGG